MVAKNRRYSETENGSIDPRLPLLIPALVAILTLL